MGVYTGLGLCDEFDHKGSQNGHANVCQAIGLLWGSQGIPDMKHSGCKKEEKRSTFTQTHTHTCKRRRVKHNLSKINIRCQQVRFQQYDPNQKDNDQKCQ